MINAAVPFTVSERQGGISIQNMKSSQCVSGVENRKTAEHTFTQSVHTYMRTLQFCSACLLHLHSVFSSLRASSLLIILQTLEQDMLAVLADFTQIN